MKTIKIILGEQGLNELEKYLQKMKNNLDEYPTELVKRMVKYTERQMQKGITAVIDKDGNSPGTVTSDMTSTKGHAKATISYGGLGAMFLEFGTGMIGKGSPHPNATELGWDYYIDTRYKTVRDGEYGWWHNKEFHVGIPSGRIGYNAGRELRTNKKTLMKQVWRGLND